MLAGERSSDRPTMSQLVLGGAARVPAGRTGIANRKNEEIGSRISMIIKDIKSLNSNKMSVSLPSNFKQLLARIAVSFDFISAWFYAPLAHLHPATGTYRAGISPQGTP
jgi:hypothetical protein